MAGVSEPTSSSSVTSKNIVKEHFGEAVYVVGRVKKNRVLIYQSRSHPQRVYEWCLVRVFTRPVGYSTWMCTHCSVIKQRSKKQGVPIDKKVPRILVDNDFIREDPDNPLNPHFCQGKDVIQAAVSRARMQVIQECEASWSADSTCRSKATEQRLLETPESEDFNFLAPTQRKALKRVLLEDYPFIQKRVDRLVKDRTEQMRLLEAGPKETSNNVVVVSSPLRDHNSSIDSRESEGDEETDEVTAPQSVEEIIGPFEEREVVVEVEHYDEEIIEEHYGTEVYQEHQDYAGSRLRLQLSRPLKYDENPDEDEIIDVEHFDLD